MKVLKLSLTALREKAERLRTALSGGNKPKCFQPQTNTAAQWAKEGWGKLSIYSSCCRHNSILKKHCTTS